MTKRRVNFLISLIFGAVALAGAYITSTDYAGYVGVVLIGGFVGAVELLGRYLYAPVRAIFTASGIIYIAVNMIAAASAYYMIGPHGFNLFTEPDALPPRIVAASTSLAALKSMLLAGFGALGFMRSSIFKVRVGESSIGIGPAAILDTLLMVADRGVDRQEAILRAREVTDLLAGVDPVKGAALLTSYCFALMQNVSKEEQQNIEDAVKKIASADAYSADIRLDLIALALSKVVGPTVLEAAVIALGDRLRKIPSSPAVAQTTEVQPHASAQAHDGSDIPDIGGPVRLPVSSDELVESINRAQTSNAGH